MWSRYQPSRCQLLDPCLSTTLSHLQTYEDYWEDASVSLKCADDWGMPDQVVCDCSSDSEVAPSYFSSYETAGSEGRNCLQEQQSHADCTIVSDEELACRVEEDEQKSEQSETEFSDLCRGFPPPIATCSTLSIKKGGRFVLKEMNAHPYVYFRSQRENGRLRLQLIEPILADDEDDEPDSEDEFHEFSSEVSVDQFPREDVCRTCGIDGIETGSDQSEEWQTCRSVANAVDVSCSISLKEIESGVRQIDSKREAAVMTVYDENGLVNRIVESMQIDSRLGFGVQSSRQQAPSPLWITREGNVNMWPASQMFLPQPLTRVSPVVGY